ncbi:MAG: DUF456 domain-containing protein, partial [Deltaproteobacteria bacterium]|nr:DUF456 domain-containing protein [Deltaproteobacteria bacterium]
MEHLFFILLIVLAGLSFFLVFLGLPGTWLLAAGALLYGIFFPFQQGEASLFSVVGVLVLIAALAEILEFLVGTFGAKKFKVSNGGLIAAFIGGLIGLIVGVPIFLIGSLVGMLLGSF